MIQTKKICISLSLGGKKRKILFLFLTRAIKDQNNIFKYEIETEYCYIEVILASSIMTSIDEVFFQSNSYYAIACLEADMTKALLIKVKCKKESLLETMWRIQKFQYKSIFVKWKVSVLDYRIAWHRIHRLISFTNIFLIKTYKEHDGIFFISNRYVTAFKKKSIKISLINFFIFPVII